MCDWSSWSGEDTWAGPERHVNPNQPFIDEFPSMLSWTWDDESGVHIIDDDEEDVPYCRGSLLGVGGFGRVYKVLRKSDGVFLAGKASQVNEKMKQEVEVMRGLHHKHILKFEGFYEEENRPEATLVLTEICCGGNLDTYINNSTTGMKPAQIFRVVEQIAGALKYLHKQSLFHTDVKPKNIFIRSFNPMNVVLGDCGDVKSTSYRGQLLGSPGYYSPEIVHHKRHYGPADDIWALGVTTLGMISQWPRVEYKEVGGRLVRQIQDYPRRCYEHVAELQRVNRPNGILKILSETLGRLAHNRIDATALESMAKYYLYMYERAGRDQILDIKSPEGFHPIEFW